MLSVILNQKDQSSIYVSIKTEVVFTRSQILEAIWDSIHVQMVSNLMRQKDE